MADKKAKETKKVSKVKKQVSKSIDINKEEVIKEIKEDLTLKVKEQITKELIDNIKGDIKTLVTKEVTEEIKKNVEKESKKQNRRLLRGKRGKIFRRDIVIIILLLIIAYLVWFMYNHNYVNFSVNSNLNNTVINNDKKTVDVKEDLSYLLDMATLDLPVSNANSITLYTDNYNEKTMPNNIKLSLAYKNILKDEFSKDEIKDAYNKVFGKLDNYKDVSFDYMCKHFKYENDKYILASNDCIETNKEIIEKVIKTTNKNNKVEITTVVGIYDNKLKSLYNYKNLYDAVAINLNSNINILDYQNKLTTHKYTFKYENNNYYFEKIEKI